MILVLPKPSRNLQFAASMMEDTQRKNIFSPALLQVDRSQISSVLRQRSEESRQFRHSGFLRELVPPSLPAQRALRHFPHSIYFDIRALLSPHPAQLSQTLGDLTSAARQGFYLCVLRVLDSAEQEPESESLVLWPKPSRLRKFRRSPVLESVSACRVLDFIS